MMDSTNPNAAVTTRQVVGQVVNAIASRDWAALAASVHADIVYWRPGTLDRVDGVDSYVDEWRNFIGRAGGLTYRPHTVLVDGDTAMVEASAEFRPAGAATMTYSMVSVMRVAEGKLVEEREYIVPAANRPQ